MLLSAPVQLKKSDIEPEIIIRQQSVHDQKPDKDRLYCAYCHFHITDSAEAISQSGSHTHTFTNPAGYVYTVDCFAQVPGCASSGRPDAAHSWFRGYSWQLALCRSCGQHLGWRFSNASSFFVLIQGRFTRLS